MRARMFIFGVAVGAVAINLGYALYEHSIDKVLGCLVITVIGIVATGINEANQ